MVVIFVPGKQIDQLRLIQTGQGDKNGIHLRMVFGPALLHQLKAGTAELALQPDWAGSGVAKEKNSGGNCVLGRRLGHASKRNE